MQYAFSPAPVVTVPIIGQDNHYPVNRIFCVGRNYAEHTKEMGFNPDRDPPFYFTKSPINILAAPSEIPYPPQTENYHHEIELVVAIGQEGFEIPESDALGIVFGYATGLDMTRRDLQLVARDKGRPWCLGKDVEGSAVISRITPVSEVGHLSDGAITVTVNDEMRQQSDIEELIWSVPELIANLSNFYHLAPGDLIYTGTPAGVGPVLPGDKIKGHVAGLESLDVTVS